jgi:hypothetical protein
MEKVAGAVLSPYGCPAVRTKNNKISAQTIARIIRLSMKRFAVISTGAMLNPSEIKNQTLGTQASAQRG